MKVFDIKYTFVLNKLEFSDYYEKLHDLLSKHGLSEELVYFTKIKLTIDFPAKSKGHRRESAYCLFERHPF